MESLGFFPYPWQCYVIDTWLALDSHGKYASTANGLAVPRQNGKNGVIEIREVWGLSVIGERILHTAHEGKTSETAFKRLLGYYDDPETYPELAAQVKKIRRSDGKYSIELNNGGIIQFNTRTRGAARGTTNDVVIIDEAQELTDDQLDAILQTTKAAPSGNRQIIYTGTPPGPASPGTVFKRIRKSAINGTPERMSWLEWSVEEIGDITDVDRWYDTNPSLGYSILEQTFADDVAMMDESGFAREALGWWTPENEDAVIGLDEWTACLTQNPPMDGTTVYAVKFAPDGDWVAIAVGLKPADGKPHVELVDFRSMRMGVTTLADWLIERKDRAAQIVVDGKSYTAELTAQLRDGGVPQKAIIECKPAEIIESSTRFLTAIREKKATVYPSDTLTATALACSKRAIGNNGGWGWQGTKEINSAPLEAASLAYWGAMTTKRKPGRKVRLL